MRLLIVGSLNGQIGAASRIAIQRGAKVTQAESISAGLEIVRGGPGADLIMADLSLDLASLIGSLASERINVPVVACGIETDSRAAVAAIKAGAKEYIPLPPDAELIAAVLEAVAAESDALIHADPAMERVMQTTKKVASSQASVLITGESGTGKELVARTLHRNSPRKDRPFVAVNCAAIPGELLESELFGHERGAFTGAVARRIGKFEEANGGTLLLDEISEMDLKLQAKLLRAIQEREVVRIGSNTPVKVDTRIVATSNRNMEDAVKKGAFRDDLYFRLNVVKLVVPPLRDRPADIEPLARHFVRKYAEENGVAERPLTPEAMTLLKGHKWPGNVRELENTLHRAVLLASGDTVGADAIVLGDAVSSVEAAGTGGLVGRTVADVERDLIIDTLKHTLGNRTHAARILGISIRTLRNKLNTYVQAGLNVPPPGAGEAAE
ncbi:MAG: sigma-54-dependent Fis family transcriptional regulator [Alphaproteobacteria bacterium]|nr:sigma-54-dependent Fis family transcriptional regulator [Alphaproteobacteria bacterium]